MIERATRIARTLQTSSGNFGFKDMTGAYRPYTKDVLDFVVAALMAYTPPCAHEFRPWNQAYLPVERRVGYRRRCDKCEGTEYALDLAAVGEVTWEPVEKR